MKLTHLSVLALSASVINARFVERHEKDQVVINGDIASHERFLIELAPGQTQWVTEEEKWELRRVRRRHQLHDCTGISANDASQNGQNFMDITETRDLGAFRATSMRKEPKFPSKPVLPKDLYPMMKNLSKSNMKENLETFTSFYTRYYKSDYGRQSSEWLLKNVQTMIKDSGADKHGVYAEPFKHPWGQNSVIATIPGKSNSTIVMGAHQDSINLFIPSILSAPGADDDGSGTVTILEAFRVLLTSKDIIKGKGENTIEFHWYSAEEGGLLGSQAIFSEYEKTGRDIKAMLQQDMTGFVQGTLDAGKKESMGVITDFVDPALTDFVKRIITQVSKSHLVRYPSLMSEKYCEIPYVETTCGYACSDHASASKAGYPSAFVIESEFADSDKHIHTSNDLIKYLSFDHMLQYARLTLGLVYELAFAKL